MKKILIICAAVLLLVVFMCGACGLIVELAPNPNHQVTYNLTGTSLGATITYENSQGGTQQGDVRIPWSITYTMKYGDFAYISAQNYFKTGSVTCTILVDGKPWRTSTSEGAYVIADCSGSIGH